ncbi:hypothetical protein [Profundibacter amoris]|nr:hypothetical protein [Profundibacter amoris]
MIRRVFLVIGLSFGLSGCMETGTSSPKVAVSKASPASFITTFDRYCAANIGNLDKAVRLLQKDGYVPMAKIDKTLTVYSRSPNQPFVGIDSFKGSPIACAVISQPDKSLKPAVAAYMGRVRGARPIEIDGVRGNFDASWVTDVPYKTFYVTFTSSDPTFGRIYTFLAGKAQN